jgi:transitional endoplasmic reticulum ATPase
MSEADPIDPLIEALSHSPNNVPLRRHVAGLLTAASRHAEAEEHLREAARLEPANADAQLDLAQCFERQNKLSEALVVVESLADAPGGNPKADLLLTRLLLRRGDVDGATTRYQRAIDADENLADDALANQLGISRWSDEEESDEAVDYRVPNQLGGGPVEIEMERPKINFSDVGGMDPVKEDIRMKIIHPLTNPDLYKAYGKSVGGGILLYGPPGCGKTLMARATAGEVKAGFMSIGLHDVLEMWIGSSERNLHEIFQQARRINPSVLFFDEVDALGASRSDMRTSGSRQVINQFLSEMDGAVAENDGVLILAATNAPWHLDSAFRRPGRFDRIIFVPPPDEPARAAILDVMLQNKPTKDVNTKQLAAKSKDFSGADLKAAVDVAIEAKLRVAMAAGVPEPLTTKDLLKGIKQVKPSTREWFSTARNYALYSNQGGIYDDILDYLKMR